MDNWHFIAPPNPTVEKSLGIVRCSVCSRLLTNPESVAKGIGPVCAAHGVAKHMGPKPHPSGSSQQAHAGRMAARIKGAGVTIGGRIKIPPIGRKILTQGRKVTERMTDRQLAAVGRKAKGILKKIYTKRLKASDKEVEDLRAIVIEIGDEIFRRKWISD